MKHVDQDAQGGSGSLSVKKGFIKKVVERDLETYSVCQVAHV